MKKIIPFLILIIFSSAVFSQEAVKDTTKKEERRYRHSYKDIIAIDATTLLRQFFNFNSNNYYNGSPYMITYRRFFKRNAVRFGIGGNINSSEKTTNDSLKSKNKQNNYSIGLGFEHYNFLSRRWSYYFGFELTTSNFLNYSTYSFSTTNYQIRNDVSTSYGISPLIGIVFRISRRMSVGTETSYNFSYVHTISQTRAVPWNPYNTGSSTRGFQSNFIPPTSISFRFKF